MSGWPVTPSAANMLNQHHQFVVDGSSGGGMVTQNFIGGGGGHQNIGGGGLNNVRPPLLHQEQAYNQIWQALEAPNAHRELDQALQLLKTNPQLLIDFIRYSQAQQQQAQQLFQQQQQQLEQDMQKMSLF